MIVLRYYGDCSLEEIGAALGGKPGTVRATLHQALGRLRRLAPRPEAPITTAQDHDETTNMPLDHGATTHTALDHGEVSHEQG